MSDESFESGFVTGHGFSRAEKSSKHPGFSPCGMFCILNGHTLPWALFQESFFSQSVENRCMELWGFMPHS